MGSFGEGRLDMVPMFEVAFLVVCAAFGLWWFRRTNISKAHRRYGFSPGRQGTRVDFGMYQPSRPTPPPAALHGYEGPRRRWWFSRKDK